MIEWRTVGLLTVFALVAFIVTLSDRESGWLTNARSTVVLAALAPLLAIGFGLAAAGAALINVLGLVVGAS